MIYQGLVRVHRLRMYGVRFEQTDLDTEFLIDVLISGKLMPVMGLRMSTKESGNVPEVGSYVSVLIKDDHLVIVGD